MDIPQARNVERGTLSASDIEGLVAPLVRADHLRRCVMGVEYNWEGRNLYFHDGDLEIDGDLLTDEDPWTEILVVRGDLTVRGLHEDWDIEPESIVVVTGDLRAGRMIGRGWLEVHGDLRVDDVALFERNDCGTEIHGDLTAQLVLALSHHVMVHGRVRTPVVNAAHPRLESPNDVDEMEWDDPRVRSLLAPEFLDIEDGAVADDEAMVEALRAGRSSLVTDRGVAAC